MFGCARRILQAKTDSERLPNEAIACLYRDFNVFAHYNVDKYLNCCGLSVAENYRGRAIGLKMLQVRWVESVQMI